MRNKKKFLCLLLAVLTLTTLVLTSCSDDDEEIDLSTVRSATYLTFYAITEKGTTDEAITMVQDEGLPKYTSSLKTSLVLRYYTEDKYEAALEEAFALYKQEAEEAAALKEKEDAAKKEKTAYEKTLSDEERRKIRQEERLAEKEAARKAAQEQKELLERIEAGIEDPPDPITGAQVDILYINGYDHYLDLLAGGDSFPGTKLLTPLDEYLKRDEKLITNYVNPVLLQAAKVDGTTYGIPINKLIAEKGQYFVYNTELLEKYDFDVSFISTLYSLEDMLAEIKEKEPNVIPMVAPVEANGLDFYGEVGSALVTTSSEKNTFSSEEAQSTFKSFSVKAHFERMANFRSLGYFKDSYPSGVKDFFVEVREGTAADVAKWREEGYTVTVYKAPKATTEECLTGLYGICSKSKLASRAAEILTLLYTNAGFRTMLTYGIENVHYTLNEDGYVEKISNDYNMDFMKTGNTLIGNVEEKYKDYRALALEANSNLRLNGFLGYDPKLKEEDQKKLDQANKIVKGKYLELCKGPENWEEIYNKVVEELDKIEFNTFVTDSINSSYPAFAANLSKYDASRTITKPEYFKPDPNAPKEEETPAA